MRRGHTLPANYRLGAAIVLLKEELVRLNGIKGELTEKIRQLDEQITVITRELQTNLQRANAANPQTPESPEESANTK